MTKKTFYILSLTWGLPITFAGAIVALALIIYGYEPKKWGDCMYFEIGEHWGGFNIGPVFLIQKYTGDYLKDHEYGHGIQNCFFGPLTPFIIILPSVIRYWYREFRERSGDPCTAGYYDIWFERQASELGTKYRILRSENV